METIRGIPPFVLARAFLGMFFSYYITGVLMEEYAARNDGKCSGPFC